MTHAEQVGSDAVHGDTCVDDRGTDAEPFRVMVWTGARASRNRGGYWSHWANYAELADAERIARGMVASNTDEHTQARYAMPRPRFHGVTRHRFPLP